ncbi:MAG: HNH endonuclease [Campylobacterales bacterium]|nr:HNH endonuclease [Campylobacterales bacterium]
MKITQNRTAEVLTKDGGADHAKKIKKNDTTKALHRQQQNRLMRTILLHKDEAIRNIEGFEGLYSITSFGRIFSHRRHEPGRRGGRRHSGLWIRPTLTKNGYLRVVLRDRFMQQHSLFVHRIVADAFLEKVEGKDFVNHKNLVKVDNRTENLEWTTTKENCAHYCAVTVPYYAVGHQA